MWKEKGEAVGTGKGRMGEKGEGEDVEAEGTGTLKVPTEGRITELGEGSHVVYNPRLIGFQEAWNWFDYLNTHIPWTRPTIRVFGRSCLQVGLSLYLSLYLSVHQWLLVGISL